METGEFVIVEVTDKNFDDFNFDVFADADWNIHSLTPLPENEQGIEKLDLFIERGSEQFIKSAGIFYDKKTNTFFVYSKVNSMNTNGPRSTNEDRRKADFAGNLTQAGILLITKPT